jgi:hypothetical protein
MEQARIIAAALKIPVFVHRPFGEDGTIIERLRSYLTPNVPV